MPTDLTPYRIWALHCPFRKNGTPVLGTMGSTIQGVIVIQVETWRRMVREIPALAAAPFEVGEEADAD